METWRREMMENELYHHGILGMRWGVRRFQNKDGSYTSAGRNRYGIGNGKQPEGSEDKKKQHKGLTDKQKRAIKIGAAVAVSALAAYGAYKIASDPTVRALVRKGLDAAKNTSDIDTLIEESGPTDSVTGLKMLKKPMTNQGNCQATNPFFKDPATVNPFDESTLAHNMNCGNCVLAFEARTRGYDVQALGNKEGMTIAHIGQFFDGINSNTFCEPRIDVDPIDDNIVFSGNQAKIGSYFNKRGKAVSDSIKRALLEQYSDSKKVRGAIMVPGVYGSHWISYEKNGNNVDFMDPQSGNKVDLVKFLGSYTYHRNSSSAQLTSVRLDNLSMNNNIKNVIGNVDSVKEDTMSNFDTSNIIGNGFVTKDDDVLAARKKRNLGRVK